MMHPKPHDVRKIVCMQYRIESHFHTHNISAVLVAIFFAAAQKTGKGFIYIRIIYISMPRMRAPVEQKSILHFQHVYL